MNSSINRKIFNYITLSPHFFSKNNISFMSRNCDEFYLGFIIPRALGSATKRNLFRRRCRASLVRFEEKGLLPLRGLVIRPKYINSTFNEINDTVSSWVILNNKKEVA